MPESATQTVTLQGATYTFEPDPDTTTTDRAIGHIWAPTRATLMVFRRSNGSVTLVGLGRKFWTGPEETALIGQLDI